MLKNKCNILYLIDYKCNHLLPFIMDGRISTTPQSSRFWPLNNHKLVKIKIIRIKNLQEYASSLPNTLASPLSMHESAEFISSISSYSKYFILDLLRG